MVRLRTLALVLLAIWVAAPWLPWWRGAIPRTLVLYGFSILGVSINQGVFPAFQARWLAEHGEKVELVSSFSGSGTVTNQLILGVPAQIAILALELDALKLAEAGVVAPLAWRRLPRRGILNRTPFVILTRPGNPLNIRDFSDLARPGLSVIHPDPLTSGGAQWALLAEYGALMRSSGDSGLAQEQMLGIWRNVTSQAASARAALTQFEGGFGDALITYEQDLLGDYRAGRLEGDIVYPPATIFSEHPVVVVERNVADADRDLVEGFVNFLWSAEAQEVFASYGFRSQEEQFNRGFRPIQAPFTVQDLGGWPAAKEEIVEGIWKARIVPRLNG